MVFVDPVLDEEDTNPGSREESPCQEGCDNNPALRLPSVNSSRSVVVASNNSHEAKVTVATQTGQEGPDLRFNPEKMTVDRHCYECKVRYRDPKPEDLVMYLHAWTYKVGIHSWNQVNIFGTENMIVRTYNDSDGCFHKGTSSFIGNTLNFLYL